MSSNRLNAIIQYFVDHSHLGTMAIAEEEFDYFRKIVSTFVNNNAYLIEEEQKEVTQEQEHKRCLMAYDCLWLILSQIENVNQRFYQEKHLERLNVPERQIPYALAMAIFEYLAREIGNAPTSAFHNLDQHAFFEIFRMTWRNEEWNRIEQRIISELRAEVASERDLRGSLASIASRYQDNVDGIETKIQIQKEKAAAEETEEQKADREARNEEALQQAILDLKSLIGYLRKANLLDEYDETILNSLCTHYQTIVENYDGKTAYHSEASLMRLLPYLMDIRYNFNNARRAAGFIAPGMMVPASILVEALKMITNSNLPVFKPTEAEWSDYALRTSFGKSYGQLLASYPHPKLLEGKAKPIAEAENLDQNAKENEAAQPDIDPQEIPYIKFVSVLQPSEIAALTAIKYNELHLHEGPSSQEVLARVWALINKEEINKEEDKRTEAQKAADKAETTDLARNLSAEMQKLGNLEELDPFEVMVNMVRVVNNKRPNIYLLDDVNDMQGLIGAIVDPYIATVIQNSGTLHHNDNEIALERDFSQETLNAMRAAVDHQLEHSYGFVWTLYPDKEAILNDLISVKSIIAALNEYRVASGKKDSTQLEDYVKPFITTYVVNEVKKAYMRIPPKQQKEQKEPVTEASDSIVTQDLEKPLDFTNPDEAITIMQKKMDDDFAEELEIIWTWHPERFAILEKWISKQSLIAAYQIAVEGINTELTAPVPIVEELAVIADHLIQDQISKEEKYATPEAEAQAVSQHLADLKQNAGEMFAKKFKLVWTLRQDQAETLDLLFSLEAFNAAKKKVHQAVELFADSLRPSILKFLAERVQNPNVNIADLKAEKLLPELIAFHLPAVQTAVNQRKLALQKSAVEFLQGIITRDFVYELQVKANADSNLALGDTVETIESRLIPMLYQAMQDELKVKSIQERMQEIDAAEVGDVDLLHPERAKLNQAKAKIIYSAFLATVKKLGIAFLWNNAAVKVGASIKTENLLAAAQNEINTQRNPPFDMATAESLNHHVKKVALQWIRTQFEKVFEPKEDELIIDKNALNAIVKQTDQPLSQWVDAAVIDKQLTNDLGFIWMREEKDSVFNQIIVAPEEIWPIEESVLLEKLQPKVQEFLNDIVYGQVYHRLPTLEQEPDETKPFSVRVIDAAKEQVDAYMKQYVGDEYWVSVNSRRFMLDRLVTNDTLSKAQHAIEIRNKQIDAVFLTEKATSNEMLLHWTNHLARRIESELFYVNHYHQQLKKRLGNKMPTAHEAKQLQKRAQLLEEYNPLVTLINAYLNLMRTDVLAGLDEARQASYLTVVKLYQHFNQYANMKFESSVFITHTIREKMHKAIAEMQKEVEKGHFVQAADLPVVQEFIQFMDLYNSIEKAQPEFDTLSSYMKVVEEEVNEDNVIKRLTQTISLFKDYQPDHTGLLAGFYQFAKHPRRHHDKTARSIVIELNAYLAQYMANKQGAEHVLSDVRYALMDRMIQLIQDKALKEDFMQSSFGRRLIFAINNLLKPSKQPLKINLSNIDFKAKIGAVHHKLEIDALTSTALSATNDSETTVAGSIVIDDSLKITFDSSLSSVQDTVAPQIAAMLPEISSSITSLSLTPWVNGHGQTGQGLTLFAKSPLADDRIAEIDRHNMEQNGNDNDEKGDNNTLSIVGLGQK